MTRLAMLALPLLGACSGVLDDQTLGTKGDPSGGPEFRSYAAIGTSIGAGIQSGGINDSTQREAYTHLLARAMGYTPGVDWNYPSMAFPGCPPPFTNPLTPGGGSRIGGGTATTCTRRAAGSARAFMNNASVPFLRVGQVLDIQVLDFPLTDSLKQMPFLLGSLTPMQHVQRARPTFVTVEIGANDVLHAATRGDVSLLTPLASFTASLTAVADSIDAITSVAGAAPNVAIAGIPNVTRIPHMTAAAVLFCLKTGACPPTPATPPFNLATFTIDASCAPAGPGAVGTQYLLPFTTLATIVGVLTAGGAANINCATDVATVTTAAGTGPAGATVNTAEYATIVQRVTDVNAAITTLATARGYAFANFDSALVANAAAIPPIPSFSTPTALFGTLFSLDGVHPTGAGQRIIATVFANAINARFGTSLAIP